MILCISSSEIIKVVIPNPKVFYWQAVSVVDASAVDPNGTKTLLDSGVSNFSLMVKQLLLI